MGGSGAGDDIYDGGDGVDTVAYASARQGIVVRLSGAQDHAIDSKIGTDQIFTCNIENVIGGARNDRLTGNGKSNLLDGGDGQDTIAGGVDDDTLHGGAGDDTLDGGTGNDALDGAAGIDTASYASAAAGVKVSLAILTAQNTGGAGRDTLSRAEKLSGTSFADTLASNAGNNVLDGRAGNGTMRGGAGNDTYRVDKAGDTIVESTGQGIDTVYSSVSAILSANVENLVLTGALNINGTGQKLANTLTGNAGNTVLDGLAGNDTMRGGAGNDTYRVDKAGDTIVESAGQGTDLVEASLSFTLASNLEHLTLTGSGNIAGTGNALANTILGNAGNNVIDGKGGNDTMRGEAGKDIFAFTTALGAGNVDTVADFNVAADTFRLENAVFTGLAAGALAAHEFFKGSAAHDADDRIIYNAANGALFFDKDGIGGAAAVHFATVSAGLSMTNNDFVVV